MTQALHISSEQGERNRDCMKATFSRDEERVKSLLEGRAQFRIFLQSMGGNPTSEYPMNDDVNYLLIF